MLSENSKGRGSSKLSACCEISSLSTVSALAKTPLGSASTVAEGVGSMEGAGVDSARRCRASDSPGSNPLPSQTISSSISVEGLATVRSGSGSEVSGGSSLRINRLGADFWISGAPYFESDSPGSTNGVGTAEDGRDSGLGAKSGLAAVAP